LLTDQDNEEDDGTPKVTLMTVHAAKGLEFDTVFVVGMEEQLFPSMMAYDSTRQMEEERRLLYVAITRAEKRCFLSYAKSRFRYGKVEYGMPSRFLKDIDSGYVEAPSSAVSTFDVHNPWNRQSSRLGSTVSDVPGFQGAPKPQSALRFQSSQNVVKRTVIPPKAAVPTNQGTASRRLVSPTAMQGASRVASLTPGQLIEHERFGVGEVLRVEGTGENVKALINFKNAGEKQLLLKFARFRVLE